MPTRRERQATRRQVAEACLLAGVAALIGSPVVYRLRALHAHARLTHAWYWPSWWMLLPLVVAIGGGLVMLLPPTFDFRRAILRKRYDSRRGGS